MTDIEKSTTPAKEWRSPREILEARSTPRQLALVEAMEKRLDELGHHDIARRRALLLDLTVNVITPFNANNTPTSSDSTPTEETR